MANPQNLKPPWPKGQTGNPNGRPKGRTMQARLRDAIEKAAAGGKDLGDAIAAVHIREALKGNVKAIEMIYERLDGKPLQPVQLSGDDDGAPIRLAAFESALAKAYPKPKRAKKSKP